MQLNCFDTLQRDNERMGLLTGLKAKCERQKFSLAACREALISFNGIAYIAE